MNYLRTISTMLLALFWACLAGLSVFRLVQDAPHQLGWTGLLLAAAAPLGFFIFSRLRSPTLPAVEPIGFSVLCGLGLVVTMVASWKHGAAAGNAHLWAGACLILWFGFVKYLLRK